MATIVSFRYLRGFDKKDGLGTEEVVDGLVRTYRRVLSVPCENKLSQMPEIVLPKSYYID